MITEAEVLEKIKEYKINPIAFFEDMTKFEPDEWQRVAAMDIAASSKVSIRSGQGVGKTAFTANILLWFLFCFPFSKVVATAPTRQQLNTVLWAEIDKWKNNSPLLKAMFEWTKTNIYVNGYSSRWFAVARTATKPENMQGFHEDSLLFIVDEASGVNDDIMEAILGTLTGINNKLLLCGNPTRTSGTFYDSHTRDRALYKTHIVSALDSSRTNKEHIQAFIKKYGANSNVVQVRVYGNFPEQEDDVYIPLSMVESAVNRELTDVSKISRISFGVDVARFGDDETIIAENVNGNCRIASVKHGQDLMRTVGDIVAEYKRIILKYPHYIGRISVIIDDTGVGGGVTDRLKEVKNEQGLNRLDIVPINFGSKVPDKASDFYADFPTYLWSLLRDKLENGLISLEDDEELTAQLSVRKYNLTSGGKTQIEPKKELKKRGLDSPDRADALALSLYDGNVFNLSALVS